jgi:hypothetical protein
MSKNVNDENEARIDPLAHTSQSPGWDSDEEMQSIF